MAVLDRKELEESPLSDLHAIASELGIEGFRLLRRDKLIDAIAGDGGGSGAEERPQRRRSRGGRTRQRKPAAAPKDADADAESDDSEAEADTEAEAEADSEETGEPRAGVLDILPNGSGFMRPQAFAHSGDDVYVSPAQIRRCELRPGDQIEAAVRPPRRNERHPSLVRIDKVNGGDAEGSDERKRFDDLTPVFASKKLPAADGLDGVPYGRGSRVAVGVPPGSGITTVLRRIVESLSGVGDDLDVTLVLAGARPEEVTAWNRDAKVAVAGGAFDRPVDEQSQPAEMAIERGKLAAEQGRDAAVVIDSLDALPPGVARRVFGAARATEEGGTLTVVASTGLAGEPMRHATTRIVLEPYEGDGPKLAPASGTLRSDLLK